MKNKAMIITRIYSPATEQGLLTTEELMERYGKQWKKAIKKFIIEEIEQDKWYQKLLKGK